jgi:hypothetical protein
VPVESHVVPLAIHLLRYEQVVQACLAAYPNARLSMYYPDGAPVCKRSPARADTSSPGGLRCLLGRVNSSGRQPPSSVHFHHAPHHARLGSWRNPRNSGGTGPVIAWSYHRPVTSNSARDMLIHRTDGLLCQMTPCYSSFLDTHRLSTPTPLKL